MLEHTCAPVASVGIEEVWIKAIRFGHLLDVLADMIHLHRMRTKPLDMKHELQSTQSTLMSMRGKKNPCKKQDSLVISTGIVIHVLPLDCK